MATLDVECKQREGAPVAAASPAALKVCRMGWCPRRRKLTRSRVGIFVLTAVIVLVADLISSRRDRSSRTSRAARAGPAAPAAPPTSTSPATAEQPSPSAPG